MLLLPLLANSFCQYLRAGVLHIVMFWNISFVLCWTFQCCVGLLGWCVGCNPPSVVCGIRLIGLPAPSGRYFIGDCLPFPLAGRPFHRFQSGALDITNVSLPVRVDVSFLLRCQGSRPVPGDCNSTCGRSFLRPKFWVRKPHTNSPAHTKMQ